MPSAHAGASAVPAPTPSAEVSSAAREVTLVAHHVGAIGGMERQLAELALGLRREGYDVTVIARQCALPRDSGVTFHRVRGPARPFLLGYPWFMIFGSLALRRWRRGVLHVTGAIVLNRADVVAVHYCHQVGVVTPSRSSRLFRAHVKAMGVMSRMGERFCYRRNTAARFVCVSNGVADEIRAHYPELSERVVTIYNGVDTAIFAPGVHRQAAHALRARLGISEQRLVAVFVGSEWKRKGLAAAIEALALTSGWDLVVVGAGDRASYNATAQALGVSDAVRWLGETADVETVYEMADALVLPSSYETFSLVTFEAAASGLAILATPVNGVRELIKDGHNGFLITLEPAVIAARLQQLGADRALMARLGQAARESARSFTWDRMVREHEDLYAQISR
jgi:glycosyltransferase involved in cell wall biosynthesis